MRGKRKKKIIDELLKLNGLRILKLRRDFKEEKIREILRNRTTEWLSETLKNEERIKISLMLKNLAVTEYTLNKNYQELLKKINFYYAHFYEQDVIKARETFDREIGSFLDENRRLLHNYLASIYSLDQHTEIFLSTLNNKEFIEIYREKLKKLEKKGLKSFLIRLRAYIQHYELFSPSASIGWRSALDERGKGIEQYLFLDKKRLLDVNKKELPRWKGWYPEARKYIEKCEEKIELKVVIEEYQKSIKKLYDELYKSVIELYSKKFPEMEELNHEIEEIRNIENSREKGEKKDRIDEKDW